MITNCDSNNLVDKKIFEKKILGFFFKKYWVWFSKPFDIKGASLVNFFSYDDVKVEGFFKKKALTLILDLSKSNEELWEGIRKKYSRKPIENGYKNGIVIKKNEGYDEFEKIYKSFRTQKGINIDDLSIFSQGLIFSAYYENKIIAGHIFVADGVYMRSLVAASNRFDFNKGKDKRLVGAANRMLFWEAIKYAKEEGYKSFDFGGINPADENGKYDYLAEYKMSFGGEIKPCFYYYKVYSRLIKLFMKIRGFKF